MSDNKNTATALDDERRVKVLSPGQLVAKRFFRNRLAMVGLIILVTMFVFSFIGGMVSPYGESEVFRKRRRPGRIMPARATTAITFSGL